MPDPKRGREPVAPFVGIGPAPAGVASQATHSGGAGAPPGGTTTPREELADGGPRRPARGSARVVVRWTETRK